jgi:type IX secretion system PorP/SprF family membrane protein
LKTLIFLLALTISSTVNAQQDPLLTIYWNNLSFVNPGAAGLFYKHQAAVNYRNQWDKVNGAPNTLIAGYNTKIDKIHGGIGFNYQYETIGFNQVHRLDVNYGYHFNLGNDRVISAGISAGLQRFGVDPNSIPPTTMPDPSLPQSSTQYSFVSNIGVVYKARAIMVGISSTQFLHTEFKNHFYAPARHYNLFAACDIMIGQKFVVTPQFLVRTDAVKFSADINVLAKYSERYWAGITYRTADAVAFCAGWDIKEKYRVGYSYDRTINQLSSVSRGTHEIVLGFLLK